jgi:hypothetical protein
MEHNFITSFHEPNDTASFLAMLINNRTSNQFSSKLKNYIHRSAAYCLLATDDGGSLAEESTWGNDIVLSEQSFKLQKIYVGSDSRPPSLVIIFLAFFFSLKANFFNVGLSVNSPLFVVPSFSLLMYSARNLNFALVEAIFLAFLRPPAALLLQFTVESQKRFKFMQFKPKSQLHAKG